MYRNEAWTIPKTATKEIEDDKNVIPQRMLRNSKTAKKPNKTALRESDTINSLINRVRKCKTMLFDHVMRREKLDRLVTCGISEEERVEENS